MKKAYTSPPPSGSKDKHEGDHHFEAAFDAIQSELEKADAVPELSTKAYHGIAGRIALKVGEKTEADSRGILVAFLTGVGNLLGRSVAFRVNDTLHYPNEYAVIVGCTAVDRKGMGANIVEQVLRTVDANWVDNCIAYGFSSGEGLVHRIRDPHYEDVKVSKKGEQPERFETQLKDRGVEDKRCLCIAGEFGELLTVMVREGNILSSVIRNAWDGRSKLEINTRQHPICATNAHIGFLGATTREELLKLIALVPNSDGMVNRFLWALVKRSKLLPSGGPPIRDYLSPELEELRTSIKAAAGLREMRRSKDAEKRWDKIYVQFNTGSGRKVVDRAEPHTMRLAMIYAILDGSKVIETAHLEAAHALWKYCEACALRLFRTEELSLDAQLILDYLREKGQEGATRMEISCRVFKRHRTHNQLVAAFAELKRADLARSISEKPEGHWIERWFAREQAVAPTSKKTKR